MADRPIDISIITINYNGLQDTCQLIDSCLQHMDSFSYELIVVDNASQNPEAQSLRAMYPQILVIESDRNLGFAGANNLGISKARGKYLFFLNNDALFVNNSIGALIARLESDKRIAGVSPLIRDYTAPHAIQYAGYTALSSITLRNQAKGEGTMDASSYPAQETPFLHGAAMLFKREVVENVGSMPEIYFLYYEELDWCSSMIRKGYTLWMEPACEIHHKGSHTIGNESPLKINYLSRNRLLYAYRNRSGFIRIFSIVYQLCIAFPIHSLRFLMGGKYDLIKASTKGIVSFFQLKNKKH